jgi:cell wall assembly regulator SMI1
MSRLTEALESFYNLLCLEYPEIASHLQPGLTREEIDNRVKNLQFSLPEEVYELYQWRNGMQQDIRFHIPG